MIHIYGSVSPLTFRIESRRVLMQSLRGLSYSQCFDRDSPSSPTKIGGTQQDMVDSIGRGVVRQDCIAIVHSLKNSLDRKSQLAPFRCQTWSLGFSEYDRSRELAQVTAKLAVTLCCSKTSFSRLVRAKSVFDVIYNYTMHTSSPEIPSLRSDTLEWLKWIIPSD